MYVIGVDLAWGEKSPTGLAVLDEAGRLLHLDAVRTDEQLLASLTAFTSGPDGTPPDLVVALDAPLIVRNPVGNRPAEAALNRDFSRFEAGAHPVNTGKPEFAGVPRGARLCTVLGLDLDPRSQRPRRAIEVYPHAATVALFRLGRTLKYKSKPGRGLAMLRTEMLTLMRLLEGLAEATPPLLLDEPDSPWPDVVKAVEAAGRKSELRRVEDRVDAVICAYVALLAARCPERLTIYGDDDNGCIVTPTLPAGLEPAGLAGRVAATADPIMTDEDEAIRAAVREYAVRHDDTARAATGFTTLVQAILDEAGINYLSVTGRAKSVASFAGKAARRLDGVPQFPDPLRDITDQIGVRVITYVTSDVAAVADLLADQVVVTDDRDLGHETASEGRFGYSSRHLLVALNGTQESDPALDALRGRVAAVQIRTVLQHAWAEFEHDIRYKGTVPDEHAREFDRRFTLAAGLLELADREFTAIHDRLHGGVVTAVTAEPDISVDPRIEARELAAFLAGQYPDAGWSRTDHYDWISGLLLELGITSLPELSETLRAVNQLDLPARMAYRYPPGAVRRLDDALLATFDERYLGLHGNAHRVVALRARRDKLLQA